MDEGGVKFKPVPPQIVVDALDMTGVGFTVVVTLIGDPEQLFAVGVIVYTTLPLVRPSTLVRVCEIAVELLPGAAPDKLIIEPTVQVYVVPETPLGLLRLIPEDAPEQIVCGDGDAATLGIG
jgi:hypothetical protein